MPLELASMPACQGATRAKPVATMCSAMFPTGWIGHDKPFISEKRRMRYLPLPIHIAAGRGASDEPAWNGVAVDCGKERSVTQTGRLEYAFRIKDAPIPGRVPSASGPRV